MHSSVGAGPQDATALPASSETPSEAGAPPSSPSVQSDLNYIMLPFHLAFEVLLSLISMMLHGRFSLKPIIKSKLVGGPPAAEKV